MSTTALKIKEVAAEKLQIREPLERLLLVEVKSSGERVIFCDQEISIGTGISVNGRIFVSLKDHLDALVPLPEQEGPRSSSFHVLDDFSSLDLAYHLTHYAWVLFNNVHEVSYIMCLFFSPFCLLLLVSPLSCFLNNLCTTSLCTSFQLSGFILTFLVSCLLKLHLILLVIVFGLHS